MLAIAQPMRRREEDLQQDGQLLGGRVGPLVPRAQPHLEGGELVREEGPVSGRRRARDAPCVLVADGRLGYEVEGLPERVLVHRRQRGRGDRVGAAPGMSTLRNQKVAEERGEEEVLAEEAAEGARDSMPHAIESVMAVKIELSSPSCQIWQVVGGER